MNVKDGLFETVKKYSFTDVNLLMERKKKREGKIPETRKLVVFYGSTTKRYPAHFISAGSVQFYEKCFTSISNAQWFTMLTWEFTVMHSR